MRPLSRPSPGHAVTCTLLGSGCLILAACLFEENPVPEVRIVPLVVGNTWTYRDSTIYVPTEGGTDSVVIDSALRAITGTRTVMHEGRTEIVYLENAVRRPEDAPRAVFTYVAHGPLGLYTRGYATGDLAVFDDVLHVKYPATTGERYPTWFVSLRPGDSAGSPPVRLRDTLEIEVVNADTTCIVPAGTFACLHYRGWRPGAILHADAFYAPGVGYLGSITRRTLSVDGRAYEVTSTRRLSSYTLTD